MIRDEREHRPTEEELEAQEQSDREKFGPGLGDALFALTHLDQLPAYRRMQSKELERVRNMTKERFAAALVLARREGSEGEIKAELALIEYTERTVAQATSSFPEPGGVRLF